MPPLRYVVLHQPGPRRRAGIALSLLAACALAMLAGCASGPPPRAPRADSDATALRLGTPALAPEDDCANEVKDNTFPQYPAEALRRHIEGWVILGFGLDGSGKARNIRVLASQPTGMFEQAAITSVEHTVYLTGARRSQCRSRLTFAFKARSSGTPPQ